MKIICAPDSFKDCLSAQEVAQAMADGALRADPAIQCDPCPVGDGGEGTMDVLIEALAGQIHHVVVCGPLGDPVKARFAMLGDGSTAVVELAEASGLALVPPDQRDPMRATTYGTGELIRAAVEKGCRSIIVCIGGSATVDGGTGMAQAMGMQFLDRSGKLIADPMCGGRLLDIACFEAPAASALPLIRVACDVTNPLCGPSGAAAVYGPQKGATSQQVQTLDKGLTHLARITAGDPTLCGSGAAGGAGFGLRTLLGATLERGIDLVLDAVQFDRRVRDADLVLTGEGRLDAQSLHGKACMGVAARAARFGVPTIAIVGSTGPGAEDCTDSTRGGMLAQFVSLSERFGPHRAMNETQTLIAHATQEIVQSRLQTSRV